MTTRMLLLLAELLKDVNQQNHLLNRLAMMNYCVKQNLRHGEPNYRVLPLDCYKRLASQFCSNIITSPGFVQGVKVRHLCCCYLC
jgi:hypothetical protein